MLVLQWSDGGPAVGATAVVAGSSRRWQHALDRFRVFSVGGGGSVQPRDPSPVPHSSIYVLRDRGPPTS